MRTLILASSLFLIIGTAIPAHARGLNSSAMTIETSDLNLATSQGRASLDGRIAAAAGQLCDTPGRRDLGSQEQARACRMLVASQVSAQRQMMVAGARAGSATLAAAR